MTHIVPKVTPLAPNFYEVEIASAAFGVLPFEVVDHAWDDSQQRLTLITKDNERVWINTNEITYVKFDRRFSRLWELKQKELSKADKK